MLCFSLVFAEKYIYFVQFIYSLLAMVTLKKVPSLSEQIQTWNCYKKTSDKPLLVVLTGAGVSAESGLATFRDSGGLWEKYNVYEVATPEAWQKNKELVLEFYNLRRKQLKDVSPNPAHKLIAELEKDYEVVVITQNVDDLHERGGSTQILHLHGELTKVQSTKNSELIYDIGYSEITLGDTCEEGGQLRPFVVWFGEPVPMIEPAMRIASMADIFLIAGTSLAVYPAASLIDFVPEKSPIYAIDPKEIPLTSRAEHIRAKASEGMEIFLEKMKK